MPSMLEAPGSSETHRAKEPGPGEANSRYAHRALLYSVYMDRKEAQKEMKKHAADHSAAGHTKSYCKVNS